MIETKAVLIFNWLFDLIGEQPPIPSHFHRDLIAAISATYQTDADAAQERVQQPEQNVSANRSQERVRESLTFARDKNFELEAVVDERLLIRDALRRGMGEVTYSQVRAHLESRMTIGEFQTLERRQNSPARQFTTARTIREEQEILSRMRAGKDEFAPVFLQQQAVTFAAQHSHLNQAQRRVIEDVLYSPDRIQGIQGVAGAGKTTTLSVIRQSIEAQGYSVEGVAPTSRAAKQLRESGVDANTLQGFLARNTQVNNGTAPKHFYSWMNRAWQAPARCGSFLPGLDLRIGRC